MSASTNLVRSKEEHVRSYDLTPLFSTSVGFDRLSRLMDAALTQQHGAKGYPPYNIVRTEETEYRITLAVAGFREEDLEIQAQDNVLTVKGLNREDAEDVTFLHRGIAGRGFERRFQLADHIKVVGARLRDGLLHIDLEREVPEAMKPRTIAIQTRSPEQLAAAK